VIDIRKHFAHEVIQNGQIQLIRVATTNQLAYHILIKQIHYLLDQADSASVYRWNLEQDSSYNQIRDLCPQEGVLYQAESRWPLRGACRRFGEPRPKLDIYLVPGAPSHGHSGTRMEDSELCG
jgi:hypothetical protein